MIRSIQCDGSAVRVALRWQPQALPRLCSVPQGARGKDHWLYGDVGCTAWFAAFSWDGSSGNFGPNGKSAREYILYSLHAFTRMAQNDGFLSQNNTTASSIQKNKLSVIFDSSDPSEQDLDLGSLNQYCGGPGVGDGGRPGMPSANCEHDCHFQERQTREAERQQRRGIFRFYFDNLVKVMGIGVMDIF